MRSIVSCEHGGNQVPEAWRELFAGDVAADVLASHRGWDRGSLPLAKEIGKRLGCELHAATVTRLLVDLNRSADHSEVFSEYTRGLPEAEREELLRRYWRPHREAVEAAVAAADEPVLHLSVHTFTPVWEERRRVVDVGLLFDPARVREVAWCGRLRREIERRRPGLAVRDNEPYLGVAAGLTTYLRGRFSAERYLGIELEVSQGWVDEGWRRLVSELTAAVVAVG
jgi:predicted N-formylglutamate amidohydrolase